MSRFVLLNSMPGAWESLLRRTALGRWSRSRHSPTWLAVVFAAVVFAIDCLLPANGALAMLYVLPIALVLGNRRSQSLIAVGFLCASLTITGHFVGERAVTMAEDIVQRGASLIAMALMAWIGWQVVESAETAQQLRMDSCLRQVAEEAATFFRSMVDHVPIGMSRTDLTGRFIFVNDEFCKMFGRSAEDLLGKTSYDVGPQLAADPSGTINRRVAERGISEERIERHTQGEREQFMKVIRTPVKDAHGKVIGVQAIWLDVTELKQAQQGLEQYAQNLERSNVDLQQFAYIASHDLQEPLRAVSGYCQLIQKHYAERLDDRAIRWLSFTVTGAQRMQIMVRDLLSYARIDNTATSWSTSDSGVACRRAIENLASAVAETEAQIIVGALPVVVCDATQLEALFQNLIGNAVKFRSHDPPRVSISAEHSGTEWVFAVRDNGIGIKPEFRDRVFEIFKRLQSHDQYPGTGIGLAICKRIVERYSGRIWAESESGQGSTFFFTLPASKTHFEVEHAEL